MRAQKRTQTQIIIRKLSQKCIPAVNRLLSLLSVTKAY